MRYIDSNDLVAQSDKFDGIFETLKRELSHDCMTYSTLSALIEFFDLKIRHNMIYAYFMYWLI